MKINRLQRNKGFVALFTVLLASVILAMAVGISNTSLRQILLSSSATDANKSFYAADSGIECALYHDMKATPNPFEMGTGAVVCGGNNMIVNYLSAPPTPLANFTIDFNDGLFSSCANVTVDKTITGVTTVTSKGTNVACGGSSQRLVERVIEVTY